VEQDDKTRILYILDAIDEIQSYLGNASYGDFIDNSMMRVATVKQLEIIGNTCIHISPSFKEEHTDFAWTKVEAFKNVLVHDYFGVNYEKVWQIATTYLKDYKDSFEKMC
jgi:uncharacterized protein with HEPN domain